jgi:YD repeat-containing protein
MAHQQETSAGSATLASDNNGNQLTDSAGDDFTYDAWNRMAGVTNLASGKHTSYSYNPSGERVTETDTSVVTGVTLLINDGNAQRSNITSLTVIFPKALSSTSIADLSSTISLVETGVGAITIAGIANYSGDGQTFSLTFADTGNAAAENELPNGAYTLTVHASEQLHGDAASLCP